MWLLLQLRQAPCHSRPAEFTSRCLGVCGLYCPACTVVSLQQTLLLSNCCGRGGAAEFSSAFYVCMRGVFASVRSLQSACAGASVL
jgi:hypothetical protein